MSSHPLYGIWAAMLHRCENPADPRYDHYGARGIEVCDRWHDVRQFIEDIEREIGPRPSRRYTLDRRDPNANYEPGKVRWATYSQQNRNKRPLSGRLSRGVHPTLDRRYPDGPRRVWVARLHLGFFQTEEEAAEVYQRAVAALEREGILT